MPAPVDGEPVTLYDPRLPPGMRETVMKKFEPGDALVFTETRKGGEWWLISADGQLVEACWVE